MTYIILNTLEESHPLRNTPLGELSAEYRWRKASQNAPWRTVVNGAPKLVNFTFNQLGQAWLADDWKVEVNYASGQTTD